MHKKRKGHPEPIAREWLEIPDTKNDKPPTLLEYGEIGGLADDGTYWFWRRTLTRKK